MRIGGVSLYAALAAGAALLAVIAAAVLFWRERFERVPPRERYDQYIAQAADRHNVPPALVQAVIAVESSYRPRVRGKDGELGLMQITVPVAQDWRRHTGRKYGAKGLLLDPRLNIEIGTWYLGRALRRWREYRHGVKLALAQYNAGPGKVTEWVPQSPRADPIDGISYPGTRQYIKKVLSTCKRIRQTRDKKHE